MKSLSENVVGIHRRKRRRRRGDNNIGTDLKYVGCERVDGIQLPQDTVQWRTVIKVDIVDVQDVPC